MKKLSIAYFGTPSFSAQFLQQLLTDKEMPVEVKLVVTQPDQPVGRKQVLTKTPVRIVAEKFGIEVLTSSTTLSTSKIEHNDVGFLFAYGNLISNDLLNKFKYGILNTHPSLLPKYRGPGPIAYPLLLGDTKTGVTLIKLDREIDHGPIVAQAELHIGPKDRRSDLETRLTDLAYDMFKKTIINTYGQGSALSLHKKPQNHALATFTRQMKKEDGFIPFRTLKKALDGGEMDQKDIPVIVKDYYRINNHLQPSRIHGLSTVVYNLFRGLYPWPGVWTNINIRGDEKRLKINDLELLDNKIILKKVQLEGKNEVDFETFNSAYEVF